MDAKKRPLVLVVDGDDRTARKLARMLREDGYDADVAIDGGVAIGRLARDPGPDALVTDLHVPSVGGLELTRFARSRVPGLPVLIITSHPERLAGMTAGIQPTPMVFTKPVAYVALLEALGGSLAAPVGPK